MAMPGKMGLPHSLLPPPPWQRRFVGRGSSSCCFSWRGSGDEFPQPSLEAPLALNGCILLAREKEEDGTVAPAGLRKASGVTSVTPTLSSSWNLSRQTHHRLTGLVG